MKKIINGKRYDTDTAKEMASADAPCAANDFNYWEETLYRKNTGEYFLHGRGNANSRYAERTVGGWCGGSKLIPLTLETAQKWAEENLDGDKYEEIFGAVEETAEKRTVTFSLPEAMIEKIARRAVELGISKSDYVAKCIGSDKLYTADRETGTFIDEVSSIEEGLKLIRQYEETDKKENSYEDDFYDIVDQDHCSVINN